MVIFVQGPLSSVPEFKVQQDHLVRARQLNGTTIQADRFYNTDTYMIFTLKDFTSGKDIEALHKFRKNPISLTLCVGGGEN